MMSSELYKTLRSMELDGGSFAAAIARAAFAADQGNLQRLQDAFPELFAHYQILVACVALKGEADAREHAAARGVELAGVAA